MKKYENEFEEVIPIEKGIFYTECHIHSTRHGSESGLITLLTSNGEIYSIELDDLERAADRWLVVIALRSIGIQ
jgi:hypothetical protein